MDEFKLVPKKGRGTDRKPTEEGRRRMGNIGKPKPKSMGLAIRKNWQRMFMAKNPLNEGEVYIKYTNLRKPTIQEVIVVGSDAHRIEFSRDGINWKVAKRMNYHAKRTDI